MRSSGRMLPQCLVALVVVLASWHAWSTAWTCDDAFISFRYARNLVEGHGLVFNAGERVEGYTNFSWTMLCAGAMAVGLDPVPFTRGAGVLLFVATCALLFAARQRGGRGVALPFATLAYAAMPHVRLFATCGLETQWFAFLCTAMVVLFLHGRSVPHLFVMGLLGVLATMTRPDGAVICVGAGIAVLCHARFQRRLSPLVAYVLPTLLVYLPYYLWRFGYYGWPFPNTFYAKSAHDPYLGQGFMYVWWFFQSYWPLLLTAPALTWWTWSVWTHRKNGDPSAPSFLAPVLLVSTVGLYLAFVIWVGGDFMFGRFLMPIIPMMLLAIERALHAPFLARNPWLQRGIAVLLLLALMIPAMSGPVTAANTTGVVEEHQMYTEEYNACMKDAGLELRRWFDGLQPRVIFGGGYAMLVYYGEFPLAIEISTGLTDEHLAHLPLEQRGRVGHEKGIGLDPDYLVRRGIQFAFLTGDTPDRIGALRTIRFGTFQCAGQTVPLTGAILTWHDEMMTELRRRGAEFTDIKDHLDHYLQSLPTLPLEQVQSDYAAFRDYYFRHNDDPTRERPFQSRLTGH